MNLRSYAERLEAFLTSPTRRPLVVAVAVGGLVAISQVFIADWMETNVWGPLRRGLLTLKDEPMGYGGLLLVGVLVLCAVLALVESSPTVSRLRERSRQARPYVLSAHEANSIEALREDWGIDGNNAGVAILNALASLSGTRSEGASILRSLLRYPRGELEAAFTELSAAVAPGATLPLVEVKQRLARFLRAYMEAVRWVHACEVVDPTLLDEPWYKAGHAKWQKHHDAFKTNLLKLANRSDWKEINQYWSAAGWNARFPVNEDTGRLDVP